MSLHVHAERVPPDTHRPYIHPHYQVPTEYKTSGTLAEQTYTRYMDKSAGGTCTGMYYYYLYEH